MSSAAAHGGGKKSARPDNVALSDEAREALAGVTTTTSECAEGICCAPGAPCASAKVLDTILEFVTERSLDPAAVSAGAASAAGAALPTADTPEAAAVRAAAVALGCGSESDLLANAALRRFAAAHGLPPRAFDRELALRFKAPGPRDSLALLSNYDLDGVLQRWARVFPEFFPCPFAMMDFDTNGDLFGEIDMAEILGGLAATDLGPGIGLIQRKAACLGCVVNTDTSSGPGRHWVAVFVDCRPAKDAWSVEYFNSAGRPPPKVMTRWMERTRARLAALRAGGEVRTVAVTDVDHQESQTECGLYALYYIRRRLEKVPHSFFEEVLVPDEAMTAFRRHVFRRGA